MQKISSISRPIVLIGMMGSGKTTIGKHLAQSLSWPFIDLDRKIESETHLTISELFHQYGEAVFRKKEFEILSKTLEKLTHPHVIIAAGGGIVAHKESLKKLKSKALTIWLTATANTLYERIKDHAHRPLLEKEAHKAKDTKKTKLENLLKQRHALYNQADMILHTDQKSPDRIVSNIIETLDRIIK